jgi:hypothetical protein
MVAANKGVNAGWLVPLSAGLCYLGKGGCFMPRAGISKLLFHRTGGGSATFDVTIKLGAAAAGAGAGAAGAGAAAAAGAGAGAAADARGGAHSLELGQIDAAELPKLQAYCANQRIKVRVPARGAVWQAERCRGVARTHCPAPCAPQCRLAAAMTTTTTMMTTRPSQVLAVAATRRLWVLLQQQRQRRALMTTTMTMMRRRTRTLTPSGTTAPSGGARAAAAAGQQRRLATKVGFQRGLTAAAADQAAPVPCAVVVTLCWQLRPWLLLASL